MARNDSTVAMTCETPDGSFTVLAGALGVLASGWTDDIDYLLPLIHESLRPSPGDVSELAEGAGGLDEGSGSAERRAFEAIAAVEAYYAGDIEAPGRIPTVQKSGPFREHAWDVLCEVAPGEVVTYTEYAARSGKPAAVRAAASACAKNAAALFVPCHRIVRTDGSLGGFRYGLQLKEQLLAREAATVSGPGPGARSVPVALY